MKKSTKTWKKLKIPINTSGNGSFYSATNWTLVLTHVIKNLKHCNIFVTKAVFLTIPKCSSLQNDQAD